jgi:ribose-phosphate pyrophosphokinase
MDNCSKHRDPETGKFLGFEVPLIKTPKALIVDDICDGGGTFRGIAAKVREQQPGEVQMFLYVTHGIFSQGLAGLLCEFGAIYCTDSFPLKPGLAHPKLCVFSVEAMLVDKLQLGL